MDSYTTHQVLCQRLGIGISVAVSKKVDENFISFCPRRRTHVQYQNRSARCATGNACASNASIEYMGIMSVPCEVHIPEKSEEPMTLCYPNRAFYFPEAYEYKNMFAIVAGIFANPHRSIKLSTSAEEVYSMMLLKYASIERECLKVSVI